MGSKFIKGRKNMPIDLYMYMLYMYVPSNSSYLKFFVINFILCTVNCFQIMLMHINDLGDHWPMGWIAVYTRGSNDLHIKIVTDIFQPI